MESSLSAALATRDWPGKVPRRVEGARPSQVVVPAGGGVWPRCWARQVPPAFPGSRTPRPAAWSFSPGASAVPGAGGPARGDARGSATSRALGASMWAWPLWGSWESAEVFPHQRSWEV